MCGIAGILRIHEPNRAGEPVPEHLRAIPEAWLDTLDDTRLRHDLTYQPGDEPFLASDRAPGLPLVAVVFNGCIYNHRDLRDQLTDEGHRFETDHSDTEVLLHGWRAWGSTEDGVLPLCRVMNAMYAFITWDRQSITLTHARDPFGEKPLYYAWHHDAGHFTAAYASVINGISRLSGAGRPSSFSPVSLSSWIRQGWRYIRPRTGSAGEISPASYAPTTDAGDPIEGGFGVGHWIDFAGRGPDIDVNGIDALLRSSVHARLHADVPIGCFLSGGIDSSLICRYASERDPSITAFTVRMPTEDFDESAKAIEVADRLDIQIQVVECTPSPAQDMLRLIPQLGLPFGDSSLLPTWWVCQAASQSVKVALAGDGADELFFGYERHTVDKALQLLRPVSVLVPQQMLPDRDPRTKMSKLRRFISASSIGFGGVAAELASIFPIADLNQLLSGSGLTQQLCDNIMAYSRRSWSTRLHDIDEYLTCDLLRKTDTASMHAPLEVRCPFLDPSIAEAAIRASRSALTPDNRRKGLLKQVARNYLPDHIVDRPKQGFAIPVGEWFRSDFGGMRQLLYDHLESTDPFPGLAEAGVHINMRFVRKMLRDHDRAGEASLNPWHGRDHSQRLYMLVVLSIWCHWLHDLHRCARPEAEHPTTT